MSIFAIGDLHLSHQVEKPMDIFGEGWEGYHEKINNNWIKTVKENDTVILAGDISWATYLNQALEDFRYIDRLPGNKIILKGNHDYWWETVTKMNNFLGENNINTIKFLFNNSYEVENINICGTRGWSDEDGEQDLKMLKREAIRLENSIKSIENNQLPCVAALHYPPQGTIFEEILIKYDIKRCIYGHLHGTAAKRHKDRISNGIDYRLVSSDSINFTPVLIDF